MAQHENRWRDEGRDWGRDWRDEDRWRGEGRRYGDDRDEYGSGERWAGERWAGGRGGPDWQGGREVYRGYGGSESGGFGRGGYGRDTARESERLAGRTRDESRSGYGGYRDTDYSRDYGAGYGERDPGRNYRQRDYGQRDYGQRDYGQRDYGQRDYGQRDYGQRDYGRDISGDVGRGYYGDYGEGRGRGHGYETRRGRVEERGFWEQAGDEIASWFGDDDAERRRHQDEVRAAQNRGRGPRGYTRSDDRVREDVNDRLTDDPYIDASDIDVSVSKGEVTLSGTVLHRTAKRRAEDIAEMISGVTHVQNNLRVRQQAGQQTGTTMGTSTGAGASAMAGAGVTNPPGGTTAGTRRT